VGPSESRTQKFKTGTALGVTAESAYALVREDCNIAVEQHWSFSACVVVSTGAVAAIVLLAAAVFLYCA